MADSINLNVHWILIVGKRIKENEKIGLEKGFFFFSKVKEKKKLIKKNNKPNKKI